MSWRAWSWALILASIVWVIVWASIANCAEPTERTCEPSVPERECLLYLAWKDTEARLAGCEIDLSAEVQVAKIRTSTIYVHTPTETSTPPTYGPMEIGAGVGVGLGAGMAFGALGASEPDSRLRVAGVGLGLIAASVGVYWLLSMFAD